MSRKKLVILLLAAAIAASTTGCKSSTADNAKTSTTEEQKKTESTAGADSGEEVEKNLEGGIGVDGQDSIDTIGEQNAVTGYNEEGTNVLEEYWQVLKSMKPFKSTDENGKETYLNQFKYFAGSELDKPYLATQFAIVDMDGDGTMEVVVELDTGFDGAFEVLHFMDNEVYGYNVGYRSINPLYKDGSCIGSSGAADTERYRMSFTTMGHTDTTIETNVMVNSAEIATWYPFVELYIDQELGSGAGNSGGNNGSEGITGQEGIDSSDGMNGSEWTGGPEDDSQISSQGSTYTNNVTITGKTSGYVFFHSDIEYLTDNDVKYLPADVLKIARNEIYARHGYRFTTSDMKQFFEKKDWYSGVVDAANWNDSQYLNNYERQNVQLISRYEKSGITSQALTLSKNGTETTVTDGYFTITLPAVWQDNFVVQKFEDAECTEYSFYSKNNLKYGAGGHVFTIMRYNTPTTTDDIHFYDNLVSLGNDGSHYYFIGQSTDVQHCYTESALSSEWDRLSDTYQDIIDSFQL